MITWTQTTGRTWRVVINRDADERMMMRTANLLGFQDWREMPPQMVALARRGFMASHIAARMLASPSVVRQLRRMGE
jgi:hypothetical protein